MRLVPIGLVVILGTAFACASMTPPGAEAVEPQPAAAVETKRIAARHGVAAVTMIELEEGKLGVERRDRAGRDIEAMSGIERD